jgi:hypothetical protein
MLKCLASGYIRVCLKFSLSHQFLPRFWMIMCSQPLFCLSALSRLYGRSFWGIFFLNWTRASVKDINPDFPMIIKDIIESALNSLPSDSVGQLIADVQYIRKEAVLHKRSLSSQFVSHLQVMIRWWN